MKTFKQYLNEMGVGAVGGGSAGPTNVTGPQSGTDPVSATEIARNNASYNYQGNRNPYIDHPTTHDRTGRVFQTRASA